MGLVHYWKTRGLVGAAVLVSWLMGMGVSSSLGFPASGVSQASLLLQPNPVMALGVVGVALLVASVVGLVVAGSVRAGAGVFCAVFVLASISWRSGAMRDVLFARPEGGTYLLLAAETVVLGLFVGGLELLVRWGLRSGRLGSDASRDGFAPETDGRNSTSDGILAVLLTGAAYVLLAAILIPTDVKAQAMAGSAVAAFVAAAGVHFFIMPTVGSWAFWVGVMLGATVSFAYASIAPGIPSIGFVDFAPARALPIDHASAGVAAAVAGYWYSRKVKQGEVEENGNPETA